jgi:hypothetical protein
VPDGTRRPAHLRGSISNIKVFVLLAGTVAPFGGVVGMISGQSGMLLALASALEKRQFARGARTTWGCDARGQ